VRREGEVICHICKEKAGLEWFYKVPETFKKFSDSLQWGSSKKEECSVGMG